LWFFFHGWFDFLNRHLGLYDWLFGLYRFLWLFYGLLWLFCGGLSRCGLLWKWLWFRLGLR
jgi:hypothetical protein